MPLENEGSHIMLYTCQLHDVVTPDLLDGPAQQCWCRYVLVCASKSEHELPAKP